MKSPWKTKNSKIVHQNPWYKIRQDEVITPDGKPGTYNVLETKGDAALIVPLSEKDEIYLIKKYRYPIKEFSWEIPSGNSEGGDIFEAAKRELWEETVMVKQLLR